MDLTRSLRRAGRVATGIDRVEAAYLRYLLADDVPLFGLARTAFGYILVDQSGLVHISERLAGTEDWGHPGTLSRLPRGRSGMLQRAEADFRRFAIARAMPLRLGHMLKTCLPANSQYFNVGHSNLTTRVLGAARSAGMQVSVFIHDVIPLDFPQYQRPGTVAPFREKLARAAVYADRIIYNSADTKACVERHLPRQKPAAVVAHLGVDTPHPDTTTLPVDLPPDRPYFVTIGTIEPRKNHAFLLGLWEKMGSDAPPLLICGSRGWNNDAVFSRLDALARNSAVREVSGLDDRAIAALVQGAAGSLFPSVAEGFGLPPAESLALGTRALCNDLPVLREFLAENAVYVSISDRDLWIPIIKRWAEYPSAPHEVVEYDPPNWDDHFKTVLRSTC